MADGGAFTHGLDETASGLEPAGHAGLFPDEDDAAEAFEAEAGKGTGRNPDETSLDGGSVAPATVPCFTVGTLIETDEGRVPVEELMPGDRVLTRDHGFRTLQWVGTRHVGRAELMARPEFGPVRIARGALGGGLPDRDMMVSPQHRMLLWGARAELLFGRSEVLVVARHLVGLPGIVHLPDTPVTYVHVLCEKHELLRADGCWSESFQPGDLSLGALGAAQRDEILALFPELAGEQADSAFPAARMTLKAHEARALLAR